MFDKLKEFDFVEFIYNDTNILGVYSKQDADYIYVKRPMVAHYSEQDEKGRIAILYSSYFMNMRTKNDARKDIGFKKSKVDTFMIVDDETVVNDLIGLHKQHFKIDRYGKDAVDLSINNQKKIIT